MSEPAPIVILSFDFKDGDPVSMSWNGVTTWEATVCPECGANNGEHGRVGESLCPVLLNQIPPAARALEQP